MFGSLVDHCSWPDALTIGVASSGFANGDRKNKTGSSLSHLVRIVSDIGDLLICCTKWRIQDLQ